MDWFLKLKLKIVDLLRLDEKMWQQLSKEHWMISEDLNSKYFHTRASQCLCRNRIVSSEIQMECWSRVKEISR